MTQSSPSELEKEASEEYEAGRLETAIHLYRAAHEGFLAEEDGLKAAEMANNLCVVLLQAGRPQEALEMVRGSPEFFQASGEEDRAAQSYGNLGAALEACGEDEAAMSAYSKAAELLRGLGDQENYAYTMQALSRLQLRRGKPIEAVYSMQSGLADAPRLSLKERALRWLLNLPLRLYGR